MTIFNVQIFGDDALEFCSWTKEQQKDWILKRTNQKNESLIDQFLSNPIKMDDGSCKKCGVFNNKIVRHDINISSGNVTTTSTDSAKKLVRKPSKRNSTKR